MFLVTGEERTHNLNRDAEIVAMFDKYPACPKPPNYPIQTSAMVGMYVEGEPVVCSISNTSGNRPCYGLDMQAATWSIKPYALMEDRTLAASTPFGNGSWIITGGLEYVNGAPHILDTSEILWHGRSEFELGPQLPEPLSGHCTVAIGERTILTAGGRSRSIHLRTARILNTESNEWTRVLDMRHGRHGHSCGRILASSDNNVEVVVAGGLRVYSSEIYSSSRLYPWRLGPRLERPVFRAATVQGPASFLIAGGTDLEPCAAADCRLKNVIEFDISHEYVWNDKGEVLENRRANHVAIPLSPDIDCSSEVFKLKRVICSHIEALFKNSGFVMSLSTNS